MSGPYAFDDFLRYADLSALLRQWAENHSDLMEVSSIGTSYEGRDIWLATVTNVATGSHSDKPAFWVEAQIHSTEHAGSVAALHFIDRLLTGHGTDAEVTRLLDTRTLYVVPRLNPDGAEAALADDPTIVRSSTRPYPLDAPEPGLHRKDLDGDGRILRMRVVDANGSWAIDEDEPRLLRRRRPGEHDPDTTYYRVLDEGLIEHFDGELIPTAPPLAGLDLNRNFPLGWQPEGHQHGAGPYAVSEPETRAEVQAMTDRPNICGYHTFHTFGGVNLRPLSQGPDSDLAVEDLHVFELLGTECTERNGYPTVSIFHGFNYNPKQAITGGADDYVWGQLGCFTLVTELWNAHVAAGIEVPDKRLDYYREHPQSDDRALLAWSDSLPDPIHVDWYRFDHPQLGAVELGGWNWAVGIGNPPKSMLAETVAPTGEFIVWHALLTPLIQLRKVEATMVADGVFEIDIVVENAGFLPTNVSRRALEQKAVRPVQAELLVDGVDVAVQGGHTRVDLGQLAGHSRSAAPMSTAFTADATPDLARARWLVTGVSGTEVPFEVRHQRAGTVRGTVTLGER